jgi:hypothetical protein
VNSLKCLIANLPVDAGAVCDGITPSKSFPQDRRVGKIGRDKYKALIIDQICIPAINASRHQNQVVTMASELPRQMPADKTGATGNSNFGQNRQCCE